MSEQAAVAPTPASPHVASVPNPLALGSGLPAAAGSKAELEPTPAPMPGLKRVRLGSDVAHLPADLPSFGSAPTASDDANPSHSMTRSQARLKRLRFGASAGLPAAEFGLAQSAMPSAPAMPPPLPPPLGSPEPSPSRSPSNGPSAALARSPSKPSLFASPSLPPPAPNASGEPTPPTCAPSGTTWPTRALKLDHRWLQLLLDGSKTWEIRSSNTKLRGRVALASTETKLLHGDVEIVDCTPLSRKDFAANVPQHRVEDPETAAKVHKYKKIFAWHMARPRTYANPAPFPNPTGSVIFVVLHAPEEIFADTEIAVPTPAPSLRCQSVSPPDRTPPASAARSKASSSSSREPSPTASDKPLRSAPPTTDALAPDFQQATTVSTLEGLERATLLTVRAYDAGIHNLGNTCFFNALLTCLSSAEPFVECLLRHFRNHSALGGNAHCLRCRLANDCAVLCEPGRPEPFGPDTANTLRDWAPHLATGGQQCVGEAFTFLVDALDTEDYNSIAHLLVPSQASSVQATTVGAEHFSVAWRQTRRCLNPACGDLLVQPASNLGLQLELPPSRVTVLELLEEHFQTERVDHFQCETCDVRGTCDVSKAVHRWPPVLFLHVKRFRMDATGRMRKITEPLFFEELLESATFGVLYSLQAVAVHIGRFGSGHYVAYVRDSQDQWVLLNDAAAPTVVSFQEVQRKQAYILVFRLLATT